MQLQVFDTRITTTQSAENFCSLSWGSGGVHIGAHKVGVEWG